MRDPSPHGRVHGASANPPPTDKPTTDRTATPYPLADKPTTYREAQGCVKHPAILPRNGRPPFAGVSLFSVTFTHLAAQKPFHHKT